MLKIRLARYGSKNNPFFRIVVIDERRKREGMAKEVIGFYNPKLKQKKINLKALESWLEKGAQISDGAKKIIGDEKTT